MVPFKVWNPVHFARARDINKMSESSFSRDPDVDKLKTIHLRSKKSTGDEIINC